MQKTYEELCEWARRQSIISGFGAVVEIHTYMSGSGPKMTVASGREPIRSMSRRSEFVGLIAQYRNGEPYGDGGPTKPTPVRIEHDGDDDTLPF